MICLSESSYHMRESRQFCQRGWNSDKFFVLCCCVFLCFFFFFFFFFLGGGGEAPKTTKHGQLSACQQNADNCPH